MTEISTEFAYAKAQGWTSDFVSAGQDFGFDPSVLMGIASRESNMRNIVGDGGHGYSLMQLDVRSFPDFCHSGQWRLASGAIHMGASVLKQKLVQVQHAQGQSLSIGGYAFTGPKFVDDAAGLKCAIAAYNSGLWAAYGLEMHGDADRFTTGHNYATDVLGRAKDFAALLKGPGA